MLQSLEAHKLVSMSVTLHKRSVIFLTVFRIIEENVARQRNVMNCTVNHYHTTLTQEKCLLESIEYRGQNMCNLKQNHADTNFVSTLFFHFKSILSLDYCQQTLWFRIPRFSALN